MKEDVRPAVGVFRAALMLPEIFNGGACCAVFMYCSSWCATVPSLAAVVASCCLDFWCPFRAAWARIADVLALFDLAPSPDRVTKRIGSWDFFEGAIVVDPSGV